MKYTEKEILWHFEKELDCEIKACLKTIKELGDSEQYESALCLQKRVKGIEWAQKCLNRWKLKIEELNKNEKQ